MPRPPFKSKRGTPTYRSRWVKNGDSVGLGCEVRPQITMKLQAVGWFSTNSRRKLHTQLCSFSPYILSERQCTFPTWTMSKGKKWPGTFIRCCFTTGTHINTCSNMIFSQFQPGIFKLNLFPRVCRSQNWTHISRWFLYVISFKIIQSLHVSWSFQV